MRSWGWGGCDGDDARGGRGAVDFGVFVVETNGEFVRFGVIGVGEEDVLKGVGVGVCGVGIFEGLMFF